MKRESNYLMSNLSGVMQRSLLMHDTARLSHTTWDCRYHIAWIPKYRRKLLHCDLRRYLGKVFRELPMQKESRVVEGHIMADHVHMVVSIPPKYAVAQVVGFVKGKSANHISRTYSGHRRNFTGQSFWLCPQLAKTSRPLENASGNKKQKIEGSIS